MDTPDVNDHAQDLIAAYVLGAVTPDETALVEEHLVTCAACRQLQGTLSAVVAHLPALAGEMTPPPHLKARLMAIVEAEAQAPRDLTAVMSSPHAPQNGQPPIALRPLPEQTAKMSRVLRPASLVARLTAHRLAPLAALAAVLALIVVGLGIWRITNGEQHPPAVAYAMAGTTQPAISGALRYVPGSAHVELDLRGLAPLPAHWVYELWLIRGHYRVTKSIGVFRPAPNGTVHVTLASDDPAHYTLACLSVEQMSRTQRPTMPLVAIAMIT